MKQPRASKPRLQGSTHRLENLGDQFLITLNCKSASLGPILSQESTQSFEASPVDFEASSGGLRGLDLCNTYKLIHVPDLDLWDTYELIHVPDLDLWSTYKLIHVPDFDHHYYHHYYPITITTIAITTQLQSLPSLP